MKDRLIIVTEILYQMGQSSKTTSRNSFIDCIKLCLVAFLSTFNGFKLAYMYQKCYTSKQKKNYQILS